MGNKLRGSRLDSRETGFRHVRTTRRNALHASHAFQRRARAYRSQVNDLACTLPFLFYFLFRHGGERIRKLILILGFIILDTVYFIQYMSTFNAFLRIVHWKVRSDNYFLTLRSNESAIQNYRVHIRDQSISGNLCLMKFEYLRLVVSTRVISMITSRYGVLSLLESTWPVPRKTSFSKRSFGPVIFTESYALHPCHMSKTVYLPAQCQRFTWNLRRFGAERLTLNFGVITHARQWNLISLTSKLWRSLSIFPRCSMLKFQCSTVTCNYDEILY